MNNAFEPMDKATSKKTLNDLKNILYKMDFYKRESGFISHDYFGNIAFFDSEPSYGGAFITREDILRYINIIHD
jgi:hypothetical protein